MTKPVVTLTTEQAQQILDALNTAKAEFKSMGSESLPEEMDAAIAILVDSQVPF